MIGKLASSHCAGRLASQILKVRTRLHVSMTLVLLPGKRLTDYSSRQMMPLLDKESGTNPSTGICCLSPRDYMSLLPGYPPLLWYISTLNALVNAEHCSLFNVQPIRFLPRHRSQFVRPGIGKVKIPSNIRIVQYIQVSPWPCHSRRTITLENVNLTGELLKSIWIVTL